MLSSLISSVTTFTFGFFFLMMLYMKIVFASLMLSLSSKADCSLFFCYSASFSSSTELSMMAVRMTTYFAFMTLTLLYDSSCNVLPRTK